ERKRRAVPTIESGDASGLPDGLALGGLPLDHEIQQAVRYIDDLPQGLAVHEARGGRILQRNCHDGLLLGAQRNADLRPGLAVDLDRDLKLILDDETV